MTETQKQINTDSGLKKAVISKAQQTIDGDITYAPFGVDDENVKIFVLDNNNKPQEWGSLRDFFAEWVAFKEAWADFTANGNFLKSGNTPSSQNVKLWFDTTTQ